MPIQKTKHHDDAHPEIAPEWIAFLGACKKVTSARHLLSEALVILSKESRWSLSKVQELIAILELVDRTYMIND